MTPSLKIKRKNSKSTEIPFECIRRKQNSIKVIATDRLPPGLSIVLAPIHNHSEIQSDTKVIGKHIYANSPLP